MLRGKRWIVIALVLSAAVATAAVGDAHGFFRWWLRPPAPAILDVAFSGTAEDGAVKTIVVVNGQLTSFTRASLDDGTFTANVATGVLTIAPITLTNATTGLGAVVTLDPATLQRNFFNSTFSAQGTAVITDPAATTTTVPVFVFGAISQKNGEYRLRGDVRGLLIDDTTTPGTVTYTLFKLELEATAAVPVP